MKYIFSRGGQYWHIVLSYHSASTTGVELFCGKRIVVPDFYGSGFRDGLFRHENVVQSLKAVPSVNPISLERFYPHDPSADLTGPLCSKRKSVFQRSEYADLEWEQTVGEMRAVLLEGTMT